MDQRCGSNSRAPALQVQKNQKPKKADDENSRTLDPYNNTVFQRVLPKIYAGWKKTKNPHPSANPISEII
jgi:hypothetical protein